MSEQKRAAWSSGLGLILASAGSAIGLGNLWRFPFLTAQNGGGSFLLIYLFFTVFLGSALLFTEVALGMSTKSDPIGAFSKINKRLAFVGGFGILASMVITPYYSVVGGWILAYLASAFSSGEVSSFEHHFTNLITDSYKPVAFFGIFLTATATIVYRGIQKGIETFCKWTLPVLFILLLLLMGRSLTLPNAWNGVKFFFMPDLTKVSPETFLEAMGQVFFSVSVGMGVYITYGSYIKDDNLPVCKAMTPVIILDTLVSLLTGLTIFPAVFSFGVPMNSGPTLIFITLPKIFASIPFGSFFSIVFFLILLGAALTSSISLMEVVITFLCDRMKMTRKSAVIYYTIFNFIIGVFISLSFGKLSGFKICDKNLFDQMDFVASNILLPLGGLFTCVTAGWFMGARKLRFCQNDKVQNAFAFFIKWIAPIGVLIVFLNAIGLI